MPIANEAYKIYENGPVYIKDFIEVEENSLLYNNLPSTPSINTIKSVIHSFSCTAAKIWNSLPNDLRTTWHINILKTIKLSYQDLPISNRPQRTYIKRRPAPSVFGNVGDSVAPSCLVLIQHALTRLHK